MYDKCEVNDLLPFLLMNFGGLGKSLRNFYKVTYDPSSTKTYTSKIILNPFPF